MNKHIPRTLVCPWCYKAFSSDHVLFMSEFTAKFYFSPTAYDTYWNDMNCPQPATPRVHFVEADFANAIFAYSKDKYKGKRYQILMGLRKNKTDLNGITQRCCPGCHNLLPLDYGLFETINIVSLARYTSFLNNWKLSPFTPWPLNDVKSYEKPTILVRSQKKKHRFRKIYITFLPQMPAHLLKQIFSNADAFIIPNLKNAFDVLNRNENDSIINLLRDNREKQIAVLSFYDKPIEARLCSVMDTYFGGHYAHIKIHEKQKLFHWLTQIVRRNTNVSI